MTNVTLTGNVSGNSGGAIHTNSRAGSVAVIDNCIIWNNTAVRGGGIYAAGAIDPLISHSYISENAPDDHEAIAVDPIGINGNWSLPPDFLDVDDGSPLLWDLHLSVDSSLIGEGFGGNPEIENPDGAESHPGSYGGVHAHEWDLDHDGFSEWWHPGPYVPVTDSSGGWDCNDRDPDVYPLHGCP